MQKGAIDRAKAVDFLAEQASQKGGTKTPAGRTAWYYHRIIADFPFDQPSTLETAAERDRLREVNAILLEALKPLAFFSGDLRDPDDRDRLLAMFDAARAAIAKAEGRL